MGRGQKGFTLVEVLVAIAILAFTVPSLMRLMMAQTDGAAAIRNKTVAGWIAENKATEIRTLHKLTGQPLDREQNEQTDMLGTTWYTSVDIQQTLEGVLVQYQIEVGLAEGEPMVSLETYLNL